MIWVLDSGNIEMVGLLFYIMFYGLIIGWGGWLLSYMLSPPVVKLLMKIKIFGYHGALFLSFDKSRLVKIQAGQPLGYGIYKIARDAVKMLPRSPYVGPLPYTLDLPTDLTPVGDALADQALLETEEPNLEDQEPGQEPAQLQPPLNQDGLIAQSHITQTVWMDQEDINPMEVQIQEMLDKAHFLEGLKIPTYITFEGYGLALNADTVASLHKDEGDVIDLAEPLLRDPRWNKFRSPNKHPVWKVSFASALLPAKVIPGAIARRITDSQLAYVSKLYYNMGKKEAEGAGGKIFIVMLVLMILMALLFMWQGGYFE